MLPSYQLKLNFAFLDLSTLKERLKQIYVDLSEKVHVCRADENLNIVVSLNSGDKNCGRFFNHFNLLFQG